MGLPLDAEKLIPHRKLMCLIDRLNEYDGKSSSASASFAADSPFVINRKGRIERLALLELIAQTYAASKGYEDLVDDIDVSQGYLVGVSNAVCYGDAYAGQDLLIKVESEEAFDAFHLATGEVWHDDTLLMKAKLKIWISSEDARQA
jgi:predicted hotdog family 3-hydroxylacyl-ACP dehydratase